MSEPPPPPALDKATEDCFQTFEMFHKLGIEPLGALLRRAHHIGYLDGQLSAWTDFANKLDKLGKGKPNG